MVRATVTIFIPDGYADANEFLKDCAFEEAVQTTAQVFNLLLSRIDFDGMDPRTFLVAELERAIEGAVILRPKITPPQFSGGTCSGGEMT